VAPLAPEERRTAIIAATLPLLRAEGLHVSTRRIAECAGVAEGTLFRVFPDKAALLAAALAHGRACTRAMLSASSDAKAVRIYHQAGFALHSQMYLTGRVDRAAIPVVEKVRDGGPGDVDLMDSVDRATRGAGHGPDHELMLRTWRLLVSDTSTGSGYAYLDERGRLGLLAAGNRRTAVRLLWAALAEGPEEMSVPHVTGPNQWVLDVGFDTRLTLHQEGYLGLRGMKPPSPYVHNGALL